MEARLIELSELLRRNGVRVGPGEIEDATRALALVGLEDRETVRCALRACLVKRGSDAPVFERIFDLYFKGAARLLDAIDASLMKELEAQGLLEGDELKMVLATLQPLLGQMHPLARAALEGDQAAVAGLLRGASLKVDFSGLESSLQQGFFTRRLMSAAGGGQAGKDLEQVQAVLAEKGLSAEGLEWVAKRLSKAMRQVELAAQAMVESQAKARVKRAAAFEERPFAELSAEELERTATAVRRLAERLKARLARRERTRRKGALAVRRTLRRNLSWGGVPARLAFRTKRPQRPDVVVLCDVSDSVRNVSRMMLLFVHTLQSLFNKVRTFAFVSDVGEITQLFRDIDPGQAVDPAVAGKVINVHANSHYGHVFTSFARDHLGKVTRRTTVLVIGDGRNNFNEAGLPALKEIRRKAKRLIWICPEPRKAWGWGDSEMLRYAKVCHRATTVTCLADLAEVADQLVPRGS